MNIIQTWKTNNIPHEYHHNIENIRQLNPEWNYVFFNDDDIVDFIKEKMPEYYTVFVNMKHKIQQIDFFRYLAVYYYGNSANRLFSIFGGLLLWWHIYGSRRRKY